MQDLINSLKMGTLEFKDEGVVVTHPPTKNMLRAARTIFSLEAINQSNLQVIISQQSLITQQLTELSELTNKFEKFREDISTMRKKVEDVKEISTSDDPATDSDSSSSGGQGAGVSSV